jgi:aerobic-type carbon monoxide dehydrogenase small subunit (CoxS/CutS family)
MAVKKKTQKKAPALNDQTIKLIVNGQSYTFGIGGRAGDIEPFHTLAHTLRETLGLTGTKVSCDNGACGACTVIMDGKAVPSC